jgi:hypothetical protein
MFNINILLINQKKNKYIYIQQYYYNDSYFVKQNILLN